MSKLNAFNAQGNFHPKLFYANEYELIPSIFEMTYSSDDSIDINALSIEEIQNIFRIDNPNDIWTTCFDSNESTSSTPSDDGENDEEVYRLGEWLKTSFCVNDSYFKRFWDISKNSIALYHNGDLEEAKRLVADIKGKLPKCKEKPKAAQVGLIAFDNGYYTINSKIKKTEINLDENYNDDFKQVYEDTLKFLESRDSGLVILRGTRGTGKTSLIRHLCSSFPAKYRIVTNAVASHLAEPEFMSFLLSNKDSIFILEDCEQILMSRTENTFGGAITNILNMSDGLMSDIFNIKFICTFNADISKIDSALLRKGRCYANYEFKPLDKDKVKHLSDKYNLGIKEYKDMTLAEIYNYESTDYDTSDKPKKKIGF